MSGARSWWRHPAGIPPFARRFDAWAVEHPSGGAIVAAVVWIAGGLIQFVILGSYLLLFTGIALAVSTYLIWVSVLRARRGRRT